MIIEQIHINGLDEYVTLHKQIFGQEPKPIPPIIRVCRKDDGNAVGFISGFWLADDHFYIQYAGVLPEFRHRGYLRYFNSMLSTGITYSISIKNTNIVAIKTALSTGFIPIGFNIQDNDYFLQLKRNKIDG